MRVQHSIPSTLWGVYERRRICPNGHRLLTIERSARTVKEVGVRARGNSVVSRLDTKQLRDDILKATFYTGPEHAATVRQIAEEVVRKIVSGELPLQEADPTERVNNSGRLEDVLPGVTYLVTDEAIIRQVDREMSAYDKLRVERVQYSLVFRGRTDVPGRVGWRSAVDVLSWLYSDYDLGEASLPTGPTPEPASWNLEFPLVSPRYVVKRTRPQARFVLRQYAQSLEKVFVGRHDAARKTAGVVSWVMADLAGQETVTSGQLATSALNCLRKVDDIAYLRAATNIKRLAQVSSIASEAVSLVTRPSVSLRFRGEIPPGWYEEDLSHAASASSSVQGDAEVTPALSTD